MNERIEKKMAQIEKLERLAKKYGSSLTDDQKEKAMTLRWKELNEYCGRNYELMGNMESYRTKTKELESAKEQLAKIEKQEKAKQDKEATLNNMPDAMKEFADRVEKAWNEHDKKTRAFLRSEYGKLEAMYPANSLKGYNDFIKKYRYSGYEMMHKTDEEFEKENHKNIEALILNLLNRVIEKTGTITDAKNLKVTSGNGGYAVINGYVLGTDGKAIVESIGAGGYNIQKYHIRTLVK